METKKSPPPDDYDPVAPLTDEEIKGLRPAAEFFAEHGLEMPKPLRRTAAGNTSETKPPRT